MPDQKIYIPAMDIKLIRVKIEGQSNLIYHKWDEKAIKMIEDKQQKKATKGRKVRDPKAEYESSFYYDSNGAIAFPARNIKKAIVGSARFMSGDVKMTVLRGAVFVHGDKDGMIPVKYGNKTMRTDMVTVGMGSADVRYRGQLEDWSMEVLIEYDGGLLSAEQVLNLLQRAGFSQGLGEWRPERDGDFGTFVVSTKDTADEKEEPRLAAKKRFNLSKS